MLPVQERIEEGYEYAIRHGKLLKGDVFFIEGGTCNRNQDGKKQSTIPVRLGYVRQPDDIYFKANDNPEGSAVNCDNCNDRKKPILVYPREAFEFEIGDVVKAFDDTGYGYTTDGWEGTIISVETHTWSDGTTYIERLTVEGIEDKKSYTIIPTTVYKKEFDDTLVAVKGVDLEKLDKLVLEDDSKRNIIATMKQYQYTEKIFNEWGLGETVMYGKGMTMLFWGPPGTGKTYAANCIAEAIGKQLMVMDTASLQSSEPGQMERNIKEAFSKAKNKVLLFDECDSLLMTRDNVGMILGAEINCLLTEIEKYEGICILTTNRIGELDKALERRISLILEFPNPDKNARAIIWKKIIPEKLPLTDSVEVEKLADFPLTGGLIKNALLGAARLAVTDECEKVDMIHFEEAILRLLQGADAFQKAPSRTPTTHGEVAVTNGIRKSKKKVSTCAEE